MAVTKLERRKGYFAKLQDLIEKYPRIIIVHCDHVGSNQIARIRVALRNKGTILMGKNTMIRSCLKRMLEVEPKLDNLIKEIKLNIGLIFCFQDYLAEMRNIITQYKVPAPARQGVIAPDNVTVPAGATGLDPSQTSFFQALSIGTKIVKGQIEIQSEVNLIKKGDKVTASQSTLLQKLNILPFTYGLVPLKIYDCGSVYDSEVLDISNEDIIEKFKIGVKNIAALSREIGIPTKASVSHSIAEAFKFCASLCIESGDFTFPQMKNLRNFVENPEYFAVSETKLAASKETVNVATENVEEEEEDESDDDMGFSLFD